MSSRLELELGQLLSRRACSVVIKHLVKYIAYNNQLLPYTYEVFQKLVVTKRERLRTGNPAGRTNPLTFKEIKANTFYDKIESIYEAFETTFMSIERELVDGNAINEITIILGATLVSPKHIYRVQIPELTSIDECDKRIRSHLIKIYRSMISPDGGIQNAAKLSGLSNIFILVNGHCTSSVESGWFIPKYDFRISPVVPQTFISFSSPTAEGTNSCDRKISVDCALGDSCERLTLNNDTHHGTCDEKQAGPKLANWYLVKKPLSGFQDVKIGGVSVYNFLLSLDS